MGPITYTCHKAGDAGLRGWFNNQANKISASYVTFQSVTGESTQLVNTLGRPQCSTTVQ